MKKILFFSFFLTILFSQLFAVENKSIQKFIGCDNEIDEETLQHIADMTGGKFFRATDVKVLASIYEEIDLLERSEIEVKEFTQYKELYGWFLIPAFLMGLGMETIRRSIFRSRT